MQACTLYTRVPWDVTQDTAGHPAWLDRQLELPAESLRPGDCLRLVREGHVEVLIIAQRSLVIDEGSDEPLTRWEFCMETSQTFADANQVTMWMEGMLNAGWRVYDGA